MKPQNILVYILAALSAYAATQLSAEAGLPTIEPVKSFGPSVPGSIIFAEKINSGGDIVGYVDDPDQGFLLPRHGTHIIFVHPGERFGTTRGQAINDSGLIAGDYVGRPNGEPVTLGFFLSGDTYTDFVIPGALNTNIRALNNAGDFAGTADFQNDLFHPYISVGGNVTLFSLPGFFTAVGGMNNLNQVVGAYSDETGGHGFLRDADGTLTYPIDYPGGSYTSLYGINDKGWMVGAYFDGEGSRHGLFLTSPTRFVVFDYPGANLTELYGINNQGMICGRHYETFGIEYGFVARVVLPTDE